MSSQPASVHFFHILTNKCLQNGELMIRRSFVREHWEGITSPALLVLPNGTEWKMEWEKRGADVWFVKDWKKFAAFYSLEKQQVLMFKYEGKSRFNVIILSPSGLEREYPLLNETLEAEDDSRNCKRPNSPSRSSPKKRRTNPKEEARLYSRQHGETKGAQSRWPNTEKKFNAYSDNATPRDTDGRRIFSKSEASNNVEAPKDTKSSSALERAMAFTSNNLWFFREMKPAYLDKYLLFKKGDYIKQEGKEESFLSLWVTDENKTWDARILKNGNTGQIMLTTGWKDFVEANNLKLNDVCIFEKTENSRGLLYRVIIHRAKEESANIPSKAVVSGYKQRGRNSNWTGDNQFTIKLTETQLNSCAHIPYGFVKKYIPKAKVLTLQIGNRTWEMKLDYYSQHKYARLSTGWLKFVRENNLSKEDECTFQLIDRVKYVIDVRVSKCIN